jgi:SAM-dependent methyltransferase
VRLVGDFLAAHPLDEARLVDIGCGNGRNSLVVEALTPYNIHYTGLDFAEKAIAHCQAIHHPAKRFLVADMTAPLPLNQCFDLAFDCGCFHAIPPESRQAYLRNLDALTTPDALVVLAGWYRVPSRPYTDEPTYFPYLYLNEWFFNAQDLEALVAPRFTVVDELVDTAIYPGINEGFGYFSLRKVQASR